jgi:hypothetical protein
MHKARMHGAAEQAGDVRPEQRLAERVARKAIDAGFTGAANRRARRVEAVDLREWRARRARQRAEAMPAIPQQGPRHVSIRADDGNIDSAAKRIKPPSGRRR